VSARRLIPSKRPAGAGDVEQVTPDVLVTARVFTILWAIAHLMPLLREPEPGVVVVWIVLGAALLVLDRPTSRWRLALLCIAQLLYLGYQLPFAKNHVMIMACVDLGLLISVLYSLRRDRGAVDSPPPVGALPFVRVAFLVAYGAAALAKLNHGFFDADSSCANVLFEDST
jgi:hypothetical protein